MSGTAQDKAALRREILALRAALPPEQAAKNGLAVTALVRGIPRWRSASEVLAYWPAKNELDTRPLIASVREDMGIEPDALAAHRASGYEARVAKERTEKHGAAGESSYA